MSDTNWKPEQRAYTIGGREVRFVATCENGFVVRPIVEYRDSDYDDVYEADADLVLVERLFRKPPVEKLHADVKRLNDEVTARRQELNDARDALLAVQREDDKVRAEIEARAKQHSAISRIFDFLDEQITHFVVVNYGKISVLPKDEALKLKRDEWGQSDKGQKLLTLYGKTNGDLEWRISEYADGGGRSQTTHPCTSEADARDKAIEIIDARFALYASDERVSDIDSTIKSADAIGHSVPDAVRERYRASELKLLQSRVDDAKAKHDKARDDLTKFKRAS